jgi:hypothetical protein
MEDSKPSSSEKIYTRCQAILDISYETSELEYIFGTKLVHDHDGFEDGWFGEINHSILGAIRIVQYDDYVTQGTHIETCNGAAAYSRDIETVIHDYGITPDRLLWRVDNPTHYPDKPAQLAYLSRKHLAMLTRQNTIDVLSLKERQIAVWMLDPHSKTKLGVNKVLFEVGDQLIDNLHADWGKEIHSSPWITDPWDQVIDSEKLSLEIVHLSEYIGCGVTELNDKQLFYDNCVAIAHAVVTKNAQPELAASFAHYWLDVFEDVGFIQSVPDRVSRLAQIAVLFVLETCNSYRLYALKSDRHKSSEMLLERNEWDLATAIARYLALDPTFDFCAYWRKWLEICIDVVNKTADPTPEAPSSRTDENAG